MHHIEKPKSIEPKYLHNKLDLFIGIMGAPFQSELTTTILRMLQQGIHDKRKIIVWTCGYATALTQLTAEKKNNFLDGEKNISLPNQDTRSIIENLIETSEGNLEWCVCDFCMRERGASNQSDLVKVKIPFTFYYDMFSANQSLVLGKWG